MTARLLTIQRGMFLLVLAATFTSWGCKARNSQGSTVRGQAPQETQAVGNAAEGVMQSACGSATCPANPDGGLSDSMSDIYRLQSDFSSRVQVIDLPKDKEPLPEVVRLDSNADGLALSGDALLSPAEREKKLNDAMAILERKIAEQKRGNPLLVVKSFRCVGTSLVSGITIKKFADIPYQVDYTHQTNSDIRIVMFYTSAPEDAVKEACEIMLSEKDIKQWFISQRTDGIFSQYTLFLTSDIANVAFDGPRNHGDLAQKDYRNVARAQDGYFDFVAGYFYPDWFLCNYKGQLCTDSYDNAKSFCAKNGGRLPTLGDLAMISPSIAANHSSQYNTNAPYFWASHYAISRADDWLRRAYIVGGSSGSTWRPEDEKRPFVCLTRRAPEF